MAVAEGEGDGAAEGGADTGADADTAAGEDDVDPEEDDDEADPVPDDEGGAEVLDFVASSAARCLAARLRAALDIRGSGPEVEAEAEEVGAETAEDEDDEAGADTEAEDDTRAPSPGGEPLGRGAEILVGVGERGSDTGAGVGLDTFVAAEEELDAVVGAAEAKAEAGAGAGVEASDVTLFFPFLNRT